MLFGLSREFFLVWWGTMGLFVGSFLNVAIHRLPRPDLGVSKPRRSFCPGCRRQLTWRENIPVVSWALQRGRCRGCEVRIPMRYPLVELLTAFLWVVAAWSLPTDSLGVVLVRTLVLSGLVVATFVDFEFFEIPDEVSIGGLLLAPVLSLAVPELHAESALSRAFAAGESLAPMTRGDAVMQSLYGIAVGAGALYGIGLLGRVAFGRDAMGLGDVKLMGAAGGFLGGPRVLIALVMASFFASIAGVGNIARLYFVIRQRDRARGRKGGPGKALATARIAGRYVPFGPYLALGIGIVLLYWDDVREWLRWP